MHERLVLHHAELNGLNHFGFVVKLVISEVDLLQALSDRGSDQHPANTFLAQQITA